MDDLSALRCYYTSSFIRTSKNVLIKRTMQMCACAIDHWKCVNKCLRLLVLLELSKMFEQHINFSFKCSLWGYGILLTYNCFTVSWLRTIFYFSLKSYLLLSDIANKLKLNFIKDFSKSLQKYLWRSWNKAFLRNLSLLLQGHFFWQVLSVL